MNAFKRFNVRSFQFIMRIAAKFLRFRKPIAFQAVAECSNILNNEHKHHCLIVSDSNIKKFGLLVELEETLKAANIDFSEFLDVEPNPTFKEVYEGKQIYLDNKCDSLIAVGGGSVMDASKAIGALIVNPKKDLNAFKGLFKVHHNIPLMIAIPTTCGTGSEATIAAVVRNEVTHEKFSINDLHLIPKYAVFEPKLIAKLPNSVLSTTALDALTHALESYIGNSSTKETRELSFKAIKLIYENLEVAYDNPTNLVAKSNLLNASFYAGMSFTRAYVGYVHAIAHACGALYNLPHGYLCAILLPIFLRQDFKRIYVKLDKVAKYIGLAGISDEPKANAELFISYIEGLNTKFGLPKRIKEIKNEDVSVIASKAYHESTPLYPVPILFSEKELISIINKYIKED
jgi:alcohol dehydrogenase class IV